MSIKAEKSSAVSKPTMPTSQHQAPAAASLPSKISHFHELPTVIRRVFLRRILTKYQILSIGKVVFQNFMIGFEFKIKLNYWRSRKTPLETPSRPIFAVERSQNFTAGNKMSIKLIINPVKRWPQKEDWFVSQFKPVSMTNDRDQARPTLRQRLRMNRKLEVF